jgi:hypothetical protein
MFLLMMLTWSYFHVANVIVLTISSILPSSIHVFQVPLCHEYNPYCKFHPSHLISDENTTRVQGCNMQCTNLHTKGGHRPPMLYIIRKKKIEIILFV